MRSLTRSERTEFHTAEMKARRARQLERTPGFTRSHSTAPIPKDRGGAGQQFRVHKDGGGYDVLHATKGWRRVSGRRLNAQEKMRQMLTGGTFAPVGILSPMERIAAAMRGVANDQTAIAA